MNASRILSKRECSPIYLAIFVICGLLITICILTDMWILIILTILLAPACCNKLPKVTQRVQREETGTGADTEGRIIQLTSDRPVYTSTYFSAPNAPLEELSVSGLVGQRATNLSENHHLPTADLPPPYFALENEATDPSQGPPASLYVIRPPMLEPPSYQEAVQMS
ncbi:uncharacterized protein LOC125043459 [Penaeus chinensis]|uniref:uncharacterized protein LOC125043459 n=1 Tax=Penaeus chinensis TaxID=139456 RepID=UPI001FB78301|nr:uncharacterized protein LOC125043459 [Penaeus chinensis]